MSINAFVVHLPVVRYRASQLQLLALLRECAGLPCNVACANPVQADLLYLNLEKKIRCMDLGIE